MNLKALIIYFFLALCMNSVYSQFSITATTNADSLARSIAGKGVTISNATYTGRPKQAGIFTNNGGEPGINKGILLTTGYAVTDGPYIGANSPANLTARDNGSIGYAGDPDLDQLLPSGIKTYDACILEFDFVPQSDSISVRYVFASDEYPNTKESNPYSTNCANVNDIFAFFLSSPGGFDPAYFPNAMNIARVPSTTIPVAINSINNGVPGTYATNQHLGLSLCQAMGAGSPFTQYYVDNSTSTKIVYNGTTVVLTAKAKVIPCQKYHIKLTIADGGDGQYDSGVFLEAESFSSPSLSMQATSEFNDTSGMPIVVPVCSKQAKLTISRPPELVGNSGTAVLDFPAGYAIYNTDFAISGTDYNPATKTLTFNAGEIAKSVNVAATPLSGTKTIKVLLYTGSTLCGVQSDSAFMLIKDSVSFKKSYDRYICTNPPGGATLTASNVSGASNQYEWSTNPGIVAPTPQSITVTTPGTYWSKNIYDNNCYNIDTFHVTNSDPKVNLGNDTTICQSGSFALNAGNPGSTYVWKLNGTPISGATGQTYTPATTGTNTYEAQVTNSGGCVASDNIIITINANPVIPRLNQNITLCAYDSAVLDATYTPGGVSYLWNTGATTPQITVKPQNKLYSVIITDLVTSCTYKDSAQVKTKRMPVANAGNDIDILPQGVAHLQAVTGPNNTTYLWQPSTYLSATNVPDPYSYAQNDITYHLTVTSQDGCIATDSVTVFVKTGFYIPNAFSPNGDGINDTWHIPMLNSLTGIRVHVYNRYGQELFSSIGYPNDWDGTHNGKPLPIGAYYYLIEMGSYGKNRAGTVTILR